MISNYIPMKNDLRHFYRIASSYNVEAICPGILYGTQCIYGFCGDARCLSCCHKLGMMCVLMFVIRGEKMAALSIQTIYGSLVPFWVFAFGLIWKSIQRHPLIFIWMMNPQWQYHFNHAAIHRNESVALISNRHLDSNRFQFNSASFGHRWFSKII